MKRRAWIAFLEDGEPFHFLADSKLLAIEHLAHVARHQRIRPIEGPIFAGWLTEWEFGELEEIRAEQRQRG